MGGVVSIECLIIDPGDMSEWSSKSVEVWGSSCEALDDSLGLEVLAFLVGGHCTKLWGREVLALSVVAGLLISYLR